MIYNLLHIDFFVRVPNESLRRLHSGPDELFTAACVHHCGVGACCSLLFQAFACLEYAYTNIRFSGHRMTTNVTRKEERRIGRVYGQNRIDETVTEVERSPRRRRRHRACPTDRPRVTITIRGPCEQRLETKSSFSSASTFITPISKTLLLDAAAGSVRPRKNGNPGEKRNER